MSLKFPDPPPPRPVKIVTFSSSALLHLLDTLQNAQHFVRIRPPNLPTDAKPVGLTYDPVMGVVRLFLESAEFPPIEINTEPPELHLMIHMLRPPSREDVEARARQLMHRTPGDHILVGITGKPLEPTQADYDRATDELGGEFLRLVHSHLP